MEFIEADTSRPSTDGLDAEAEQLRARAVESLLRQGFRIRDGALTAPDLTDKEKLRDLHREAVLHSIERSRPGLQRHENRLISKIASGADVVPAKIRPVLREVLARSEEELLFRWARLHWSIPVSAGYGRRLRFVVYDDHNGKLIGILGLGDPVFALTARDAWVGWDVEQRRRRLQCVMDLFVLGAVPPYSMLLCGKLTALLATCSQVQDAFYAKYGGRDSVISGVPLDGRLALITTTSALGRSSLYNRLRHDNELAYHSVGFTRGYGDFHFSNGFYSDLQEFAGRHCSATAKHREWGNGFRNRRELVRKTLQILGLSSALQFHGVRREVFVAPLARNTVEFLRGHDSRLHGYNRTLSETFEAFRSRWLLPRAAREHRWRDFDPESYRLWRAT